MAHDAHAQGPAGPVSSEWETAEPATRVRYGVILVASLMSLILYLHRHCPGFASDYIREDLGITQSAVKWIFSMFYLSYALAQVPSGFLSDRFGARSMLTLYIVVWSLFTALMGFTQGLVMLLVLQLGCGLGQAGAYPTAGSILSKWAPFKGRATFSSVVGLGGRVGGAIAPMLTGFLMVAFLPADTPTQLRPDQLLKPAALCGHLCPSERPAISNPTPSGSSRAGNLALSPTWATPPAQRIYERLSPETHAVIHAWGQQYQALDASRKRLLAHKSPIELAAVAPQVKKLEAEMDALQLSTAERQTLVDGLNQLMRQADLYEEQAFRKVNLTKQAMQLLERRDAQQSLSEQEVLQLNRFVLEATFPAEVGKLLVRSWRPVLQFYGLVGLCVAGLFWWYYRNSPQEHPLCNDAERALIAAGKPATATSSSGKAGRLPLSCMVRSFSLWMSSLSQFTTNAAWLFLVTWMSRFLLQQYEVPILMRAFMVSIPGWLGIIGNFSGGLLTDRLTRYVGHRWGRALPMGLTRFGAAGGYLACIFLDTPWSVTIALAFVYFFVDLGVSAVWAFKQDVGGRYAGSMLGWGNMWGNLGAFCAPIMYDYVLGETPTRDQWNSMFLICAGMFVISGIAGLCVNATIPIAPQDDTQKTG